MPGSHDIDPVPRDRLVAVVVTHRRLAPLQRSIRALLAEAATDLAAVLVVDNASDDGTAEWLAQLDDPRLMVVRSARNIGGAGGFALGMKTAMERLSPDWLVVMDDDAHPRPGALAAFHGLDLTPYDGFAAAVRDPQGVLCDMNRPTFDPFRHPMVLLRTLLGQGREGFHLNERDMARPGLRDVDGGSFVGFFVRARVVAQRGYPDARLFLYGEDALYTLGLSKAGHRIGFDPSVCFEHESTTYSPRDPRIRPLWKVFYYYRNLLILYRFSAGPWFPLVALLFLPKWLLRVRFYRGQRWAFLRLLRLAIRDGLAQRTDRTHREVRALADERPSA